MATSIFRRLAAFAVLSVLSVILGLHFVFTDLLPPDYISAPSLLLPVLNFIFVTLTPFSVSYLAARSFLDKGAFGLLLLGCGVLAFGLAGLIAGWFTTVPDGANLSVTIFNTCMLLSGIFHFIGAVAASKGVYIKTWRGRRRGLFLGYAAVFTLAALPVTPSMRVMISRYFLQWADPILLRQAVPGCAAVLFFLSAFTLRWAYRETKPTFLFWYFLGLLLVGAGLLAVLLAAPVGGVINWTGRVSQYLGAVYLLVALLSARTERASIEETLAELFRRPAELYRSLFENSLYGIMLAAENGRFLAANAKACEMLGYTEEEIARLERSGIFDLFDPNLDILLEDQARTGKCIGELSFVRKDGSLFPAEVFSVYFRDNRGETLTTLIIRDITDRKETEEELRKARNELLDYSRVSDEPLHYELIDPAQVVQDAVNDLEARIRHAEAEIMIGKLPEIEVDPVQMRRLFRNFIDNSVKYRRESERLLVQVSGYVSNGLCHIFVKDNAMGFDEQDIDRIFSPFQRLHGKASGYDGTGTGLAVCSKVAERHGGGIEARSIAGKGSVFIITLPVRQP